MNFVTLYTTKVKEGRRTPSCRPVDRGAIRSVNAASDEGQVAAVCEYMINTLQANHSGSRDQSVQSNTKCWNCDKPGHLARYCPEPRRLTGSHDNQRNSNGNNSNQRNNSDNGDNRRSNNGNSGRGQHGSNRNTSNRNRGGARTTGWHCTPPSNDNETIRCDGKTCFWCNKCHLWNTSHVTAAHVRHPVGSVRQNPSAQQTDTAAAASIALDPSAWVVFSHYDTDTEDNPDEDPDFVSFSNKSDVYCLEMKRVRYIDGLQDESEQAIPASGPSGEPKVHNCDDHVTAKYMNLQPSANVVSTNGDEGETGDPSVVSHLLPLLLPFVYMAVLYWFLPTCGPFCTTSIMGLVQSCQPFLHIIATTLWSAGESIMSCFASSGCAAVNATVWELLQDLGAGITQLPLEAFAAPLLWSSLLLVLSF